MTDRKQTSGARLLHLLEELGMNQSDLAEHLNVNRSTVSRWSTMKQFSRTVLATLDPFLDEYHINAGWIRTGEGSMYAQAQAQDPPGQYIARVFPPLEGYDHFEQVRGDSMTPDFNPGDILCLVKADAAHIISGYFYFVKTPFIALLRKVHKANSHLELIALNPDYQPISVDIEDITAIWLVKSVMKSII